MPPPKPKQKGRIQIKIMGLPGLQPRSPSGGPAPTPPRTPHGSPAFRLLSPKLTPKLAPLDALSDVSSLESDSSSDSEEEDNAEQLHEVVDTFKHQMHQIYMASKAAEEQVGRLFVRAKEEIAPTTVQPLRPRPAAAAWLESRGLPTDPSLEEFMEACLDAALRKDLETRTLLFSTADAAVLTGGQRRVTVFDMLRLIPALFC
jgi:hypothetical protein